MVLTGEYGEALTSIECEAIGHDVIAVDDDGNQVQTRVGRATQIQRGYLKSAPEDCPLTLEKEAREIGSFTVCNTCPHSLLESDGAIEC
jgi:hypothetical protein